MNLTYNPLYEREKHPYHLLPNSPLPFLTSFFLLATLIPLVLNLHNIPEFIFTFMSRQTLLHLSFFYFWVVVLAWFNSVTYESTLGHHTLPVQFGLKLGFILFVVSEVMLFFAFFWTFFHYSLVPAITIGDIWPPYETPKIDIWRLPFINTVLLLASGVAVTAAHHELTEPVDSVQDYINLIFRYDLACTLIFGFTFLFVQGLEYKYGVQFSWRANAYGSIFFLTTGFHGMHVTVGAVFLLYCYMRQQVSETYAWTKAVKRQDLNWYNYGVRYINGFKLLSYRIIGFTTRQHIGFETAAWYWHFVDVVWLFLFVTIYWWGGTVSNPNYY